MTLLASVNLERSFIALASDPANFVICGTSGSIGGGGSRTDEIAQEGEFRNYANSVTRLILGSSKTRTQTVTLRALTPTQVRMIESWIGQTILFRDSYGRRSFCSYLVIDETDIPLSGKANSTLMTDVSIVVQLVSYIEAI